MRAKQKIPTSKIHSLFLNVTKKKKQNKEFRGERELTSALIKKLKINSPGVYVHVDRDSGNMRHTASGWDFLATINKDTIFFECKVGKNALTEWQTLTRLEIAKAGGRYVVLRFPANVTDAKDFTITRDNGTSIHVENVNAAWLASR
jgi:hypothetical protein